MAAEERNERRPGGETNSRPLADQRTCVERTDDVAPAFGKSPPARLLFTGHSQCYSVRYESSQTFRRIANWSIIILLVQQFAMQGNRQRGWLANGRGRVRTVD